MLCPSAGDCPLCAGDRGLLLLFCFLALSPSQFPPVCLAVLLFWTGQPCHYLTLEYSVHGLCIVYPYGQMANLISLLSSLLMDQQFLLAYYSLPVTSVLLFSFPSEFSVQLHVTFLLLLLAIPLSRMFPSTSCQSLVSLFGFCPFLQLTKLFVLSVLWFLFVCCPALSPAGPSPCVWWLWGVSGE